jgi:hypothetical protein
LTKNIDLGDQTDDAVKSLRFVLAADESVKPHRVV